jgi:putative radical SAM enzyme (TIGR03279 family)
MPRHSTSMTAPALAPIISAGAGIAFVEPGSYAGRIGIMAGDTLLRLNGNSVSDVIDYWFYMAAERLKVEWRTAQGEQKSAVLRKAYHERLGIELEPFEIKRCSNACVFCFVHQLPAGMRRELYVKDEDFRLSFLYGNYITGTNLSAADKERIVRQKLSPLYFSVHATDQELRERLLVKRNIEPIIPLLKELTDKGIFVHAQVVLCPGLNDGRVLEKTVMDLAALYPKLESIAVVPLGLTDHRARLPMLDAVTPEYARAMVKEIAVVQRKVSRQIGYPLVFPSDEFFLIGGMQPPDYRKYPEIPQLANGVGMYYRFYEHFDELCSEFNTCLTSPRRIAAITTQMGAQVLQKLAYAMNDRIDGLQLDLLATTNSLFGEGITVSGLLPGSDFKRMIEANPGYDRYLIPENALRPWDRRFLDDMLFAELQECTDAEVVSGADPAENFVHAALASA